jgi:hypothetical protein
LSAGSGLVVLAVVGGIQWYSAVIQKESAEALTGMERRIDEISGESRNGQDRSPNGLRTTGKQDK